jgi:hypothetical protein
MATRISRWLRRISSGPVALGAAVVFGLFVALVLPRQAALAEQAAGSGQSPDTSFFYAPSELYAMAEAYGPAGRAAYVRARWSFDVVWPLVYTAFLATVLSWLLRKAEVERGLLSYANLSPLLGALFDFGENSATSLVMARYPAPTPLAATVAPFLTLLKWVFVNGSFGLLFLVALVAIAAWVGRRRMA